MQQNNANRATPPGDRLLTDRDIVRITSLSRTTLWRLRGQGQFPPKVKLTRGRGGTSERAVQAWIDDRLRGPEGSDR